MAVVTLGLPTETFAAAGQTSTRSTTSRPTAKRLTVKKKPAPKKTTSTAASRRRAAARKKAAAQAAALKEAQQPKFKLDDTGALVPDIRAEAAIIYNPETGEILYESNARDQRSIASITKVMTAVVFLESDPDLSEKVIVQRADVRAASTTYLRAGYEVTKSDLLHMMLIASDNAAARVLARVSPQGTEGFIARMNEKAKDLGLTNTTYADTSGLLAANISSAYDMARLISFVSGDPLISDIMRKQTYQVVSGRRTINIHSTNRLVREGDVDVQAGKTGFISRAGYCLATLLRLPQGGPQVAVVVLGAKSNAGRFWETRHLFNWLSAKASDLFEAPVNAATPAVAQ
jgi:D-alanyl-D-alanine endopeptidase (penicillin-binding protein 7)